MKIHKAYRYKLIPSDIQIELFFQYAGSCGYVYNLGLEQRSLNWKQFRASGSYGAQCKELTKLKKEEEVEWLNSVPSQCLQQSLKNLESAFKKFFKKGASYPTFKKRGDRDSFRFPQGNQISITHHKKKGWIDLPKIGPVEFVCTRKTPYEGIICSATISRDANDWYVSILCEVEVPAYAVVPEEDIGLDWGVVHTLTASNGAHFDLPIAQMKKIEEKIAREQKKLSQQKKGGSNWRETRGRIAKLCRKLRRIKEDFIQKVTTYLVNSYGGIAVEKLQVKNMTASAKGTVEEPGKNVHQKSGLNRSILRASPARIFEVLKYKCEWKGRLFYKADPRKSSQECSECGHQDAGNRKNQADFECTRCHMKCNADVNAARVIRKRMQSAPQELGEVPVEKAA